MTDQLVQAVAIAICQSNGDANHPCECVKRTECADMLKAARAALAAIEAGGTHVVVPVIPTDRMMYSHRQAGEEVYATILAARPKVLP